MLSKADLHIHSKYSDQPAEWLLRQIGAPESYTEPEFLYQVAKRRGMQFVTITDHNSINGVMEIAHYPDVFMSTEATTWFPENGCAIHVLCYGITEAQFKDIDILRENVYDLLGYLRKENIVHSCAHPLYDVAGGLDLVTFEKLILLFNVLEIANGQSNAAENNLVKKVLESITEKNYEELKGRHPDLPIEFADWRKGYTGGSDDHSSLFIARGYTYAKNVSTTEEFLNKIRNRETDGTSITETSISFAHGLYYTVYYYYKHKYFSSSDGGANMGKALKVVGDFIGPEEAEITLKDKVTFVFNRWRGKKSTENFKHFLMNNLLDLSNAWEKDDNIINLDRNRLLNERTFEVTSKIANELIYRIVRRAVKKISEGSLFGAIQAVSSLIPILIGLVPYLISFLHYNRNKGLFDQVSKQFLGTGFTESEHPKKAWVTDTLADVNGVAVVIRKMAEIGMKHNHDLTIVTSTNEPLRTDGLRIKNFKPVGDMKLPQNDTFTLAFPPFLDLVQYFEKEGFTEVIISTPGTVGLAALGAARLLNLKVSMIYHTDFPGYIRYYTNDKAMEDLTWQYMTWFYDQADYIHVPSHHYRNQLLRKGINGNKMKLFPHGTDIVNFHPDKRMVNAFEPFGLNGEKKVVYIGRVAKEKDLDIIPQVWKKVRKKVPDAALVIVGDGPYLNELKNQLKGEKVIFTGFMSGDDLYRCFASGDVFIFPSTTDTFGNVVLESLASGVPVVVSNQGGPKDIIMDGKTGMVTRAKDEEDMAKAVIDLLNNDAKRIEMSRAARTYAESQSWEKIYLDFWANK